MKYLSLVFIFCSLSRGGLVSATPEYETIADTVDIRGKFADSCAKPPFVFITKYDNSAGDLGRVTVNAKGEFTYRMFVQEAGEIVFRDGKTLFDFIATANEKVYELEITCVNKAEKKVEVKNSTEDKAYKAFYAQRKQLKADLDTFKTQDLADKKVFKEFKRLMSDYQKQVALIAKQNPNTFTSNHLIAADRMTDEDLSSPTTLRENFLQREGFADPYIYNTFLAPRLLSNYMDFVRDKNDTSFVPFENLLLIASKNTDAAKRLQLILYDLFTKRHQETLLNGYIRWAETNPDKMVQLVVASRLKRLSKCTAGSPIINVQLKDTAGVIQKLSDAVASGKLTLLMFYSPTCSHCREELPHFIPIGEKYKDQGLRIFTVGSDSDREQWLTFIKQYTGSGWINVMEAEDNIYNTRYVVNSTPAFVLIDKDGKIISRLGTPESVRNEIAKRLKE
jgi:thiol-disulfide isomerase/thioredoxin